MPTRDASAKQQELEEQLARHMSMMYQEQLVQEQERQKEQFGCLLEEQQQQGKLHAHEAAMQGRT